MSLGSRSRARNACRNLAIIVTIVASLVACQSGAGQPNRVVEAFYDAAIRGDTATAERLLARRHRSRAGEIIRAATREGMLKRVDLVGTDVWAEHGAVCEIRKTFADGATEAVRLDLTREAGDWKIASGAPNF